MRTFSEKIDRAETFSGLTGRGHFLETNCRGGDCFSKIIDRVGTDLKYKLDGMKIISP